MRNEQMKAKEILRLHERQAIERELAQVPVLVPVPVSCSCPLAAIERCPCPTYSKAFCKNCQTLQELIRMTSLDIRVLFSMETDINSGLIVNILSHVADSLKEEAGDTGLESLPDEQLREIAALETVIDVIAKSEYEEVVGEAISEVVE